ncbi:MAG TPA: response regulator [Kofleriaceae bacterium]|nr:response regulator [Kofleriaceae bacterium]
MGSVEKRVLIVEDSPVMRELFKLTFKGKAGVRLDNAGDGMGALQAIRAGDRPYDLILLDLNMPVMDGMKFLSRLNEEPLGEGTVVAIVTTEDSPEVEREARALGARYFLRKPVTRRQVDEIILETLGV